MYAAIPGTAELSVSTLGEERALLDQSRAVL
jgi:hypothetical protein